MRTAPKAPPAWVLDGIGRIRNALNVASRSAAPPNIALLELAQGAWLTRMALRSDHHAPPHAGGGERTADEYSDLLSRGGFRVTRVIPTADPMSIVEVVPAQP